MEMSEKKGKETVVWKIKNVSEVTERGVVQDEKDTLVKRETCGKIVWTTGILMRQYESHWLQQQLRIGSLACGRRRDEGRGQSEAGAWQTEVCVFNWTETGGLLKSYLLLLFIHCCTWANHEWGKIISPVKHRPLDIMKSSIKSSYKYTKDTSENLKSTYTVSPKSECTLIFS